MCLKGLQIAVEALLWLLLCNPCQIISTSDSSQCWHLLIVVSLSDGDCPDSWYDEWCFIVSRIFEALYNKTLDPIWSLPRLPCLGVMCRPGWGEYSASRLMSWTPTWAKVILQLTAPCWQKARLEACFPPPPTLLIPPQQKHNTAMQTICLPLAKGGDSAPHWAPLGPTGTKCGEVKFQMVPSHPASRICVACPGGCWLLWEVYIHSLSAWAASVSWSCCY